MSKLDNYEPVKARKKRFYADYPDGRVSVDLVKFEESEAVIKASLYKNFDEQLARMPISSGYAQEKQGVGGMANKFSYMENCEESAIGRALDNAGYATNEKCSREEMIKVLQKEKELESFKTYVHSYAKKNGPEKTRDIIGPSSELKTFDDWKDAYEALQD